MEGLAAQIRDLADSVGLDGLGVARAAEFKGVAETLQTRKATGLSGRLGFTYRDPEVAADVRRSFPWAKAVIVGALSYLPQAGSPGPGDGVSGRVARFAADDHYIPLRAGLDSIVGMLHEKGCRAEALLDDGRLVDRAAAVAAGIGWWGKNTMVISPQHGPWLLLGSVVTDAALQPDDIMQRTCGKCDACIPACPTGALVEPGVLDATRCIAYWAQTSGMIPRSLRRAWGDRIYGCDDCLDACPPGHSLLAQAPSGKRLDLVWLLTATDEELLSDADHWFIPRRDPDYIRRNALVAAGNTANTQFVPLLEDHLNHRRATLRVHAAWALGEMGTAGREALLSRITMEHDPAVIEELNLALAS